MITSLVENGITIITLVNQILLSRNATYLGTHFNINSYEFNIGQRNKNLEKRERVGERQNSEA